MHIDATGNFESKETYVWEVKLFPVHPSVLQTTKEGFGPEPIDGSCNNVVAIAMTLCYRTGRSTTHA